ncbi:MULTISPECIES: ATP-binding protein [unclassified Microcoleus]|uniref:ATP-binding protein n=1 Tax=unclassified Microcoleus TaxID=2642155 RepID=UPI001D1B972C|nr:MULTISPECIES: ATP-binding protein [unclassified Microcoleus]MCC3600079.1 ATP-binding protein [Microcoleus sp. PH2017_26_ELK_O_A]MCC3625066.1 ATP-binding protein [Microcoleus sp. PH2017_36_ELK_O_B]
MRTSLKVSTEGKETIKQARRGWTDAQWCREASKVLDPTTNWEAEDYVAGDIFATGCTTQTLKNFLAGKFINARVFHIFCEVRGVNPQNVVDSSSNIQLHQGTEKARFIENFWVGRKDVIAELTKKLLADCRVLVLTGITGIGKTALAYQLAKVLFSNGFQRERALTFDEDIARDFVSVAASLLIRWGEMVTVDDRKDPERLLYRLLRKLQNNRYLVQMDSLEMLLNGDEETGWNNFQEQYQGEWWVRFFQQLLALPECQSCLILTSQDLPTEFQELGNAEHQHFKTLTGLELLEQLTLFQETGIEVEPESQNRPYLERIGAAYEGHPLALLVIAGEILSEPFYGDAVAYWKKYGHEIEAIEKARQQEEVQSEDDRLRLERFSPKLRELVKKKVESSFARLAKDFPDAYILLCVGAAYRRSVPRDAWFYALQKRLGYQEEQLLVALEALGDRYLVEVEEFMEAEELFRQHNLIRSVALAHSKKVKMRIQQHDE